jgi:two-component system cell cycle sensor histidine kinase/response regulator CckA
MAGANILVVEDRADVARDIRQRLRGLGYSVAPAAVSGRQAVEEAARSRPDVVLVDIRLRGEMEGIEAAREIQSRLDIPVVCLTTCADAPILRRPGAAQPFGCVFEPFQTEKLGSGIEMALARYRLEQQRRREGDELREAEVRYRFLYEHCPAIHLVVGTDGTIQDVNDTLVEIMGYEKCEVAGRHVLEFVEPQDSGKVLEELERGLNGDVASDVEVTARAKDGTMHTFLFSRGVPIRDKEGKVTGSLLAGMDITERKAAEQLLYGREEQLQRARRVRTIGRLAGGIAHHFSNLLTVVLGNAQLLRAEQGAQEELSEKLDEIIEAAKRGGELTEKLRRFARGQGLKKESLDVHRLLRSVTDLLRPAVGSRVEIDLDFRAEPPVLLGDSAQLQSALLELGLNARDAMPGGGQITFSTERVELDRASCHVRGLELPPGPYLKISVTDTGVGMDEETRRQAFEPFFTTKGTGERVGLGLSSACGCVQAHAGAMQVSAREGLGTRVTVYLPPGDSIVASGASAKA